jgi:pimeloyl-ACP methyl ester carboxylesterase
MNAQVPGGQSKPINGSEIYFEEYGQGEPLLFLHGFGGSGADWGLVFKSPPDGYRSIFPDMRGHGRSTNPAGSFTFRQSARDVLTLLDELKIGQCKAIGLSGGAQTLLQMAVQQPGRLEAMVIVSGAHYFPKESRAFMREFALEKLPAAEQQAMHQRHKHGPEQVRALMEQARGFKDNYDDMTLTPPHLGTITARALLVFGDRDPLYPVHIPVEMHTAIPKSYLWIVPNGGHGPIFGEASDRFVDTSLAFLRGAWDGKGSS